MSVPDPSAVDWVPLWNMGSPALPADTVIAAATRIISNVLAAGQTQPAWRVLGSGRMEWGDGVTAPDTFLYRDWVNALKTDGQFYAVGDIQAGIYGQKIALTQASGKPGLWIGSAQDTNFYRDGVGYLASDGKIISKRGDGQAGFQYQPATGIGYALASVVGVETNARMLIGYDGRISWGPGAATTPDTNLYRSQASVLKTDGEIQAIGRLRSAVGLANQLTLDTDGRFYFGNANDVSLYRYSAATIGVGGSLYATGYLQAAGNIWAGNGYIALLTGGAAMLKLGNEDTGGFGAQGGDRGIYIGETSRWAPTPTSGGYLYIVNGALYYLSKGGRNTIIGPA